MGRRLIATFVRHGETSLNVQRLLQGHTDIALSETGIRQAEALGKSWLLGNKITKAYSSDLIRAHATAQIILENASHSLDVSKDLRLRERGYGECEGKPVQHLFDQAAKHNLSVRDYTPPKGEPYEDVEKRAMTFFKDICDLSKETNEDEPEEHVLIVSHGGWLQCLMRCLHQRNEEYVLTNFDPSKAIRIPHNTGVYKLLISPSDDMPLQYSVNFQSINDYSHLIASE